MTQSQIQYFLLVAQEMSISKAAELLFVSQPAISKQLSLLENELGVSLFERRSHGIEITEAGRAFEQLFTEFQLRFKETLEAARNGGHPLRGEYHLGCLEGWDLSSFYPELRDYLAQKYPEILIDLSGYNLDQVPYALKRGEVNGVIAPKSLLSGYTNITACRLTDIEGMLLFSVNHPLADKPGLKLADFYGSPFYVTAPQGMKAATVDVITICKASGFMPHLEFVPTLSAAYLKMQAGRGVLLATEWMMARGNPLFRSLPLHFKRELCIASIPERQSNLCSTIEDEIIAFFELRAKTE